MLLDFPDKHPELHQQYVHVWRVDLEQLHERADDYLFLLSHDERQRAQKFFFQKDRQQFVVTRGVLRTILGGYMHLPPASVTFSYTEHGKPFLLETTNPERVAFNIAHSRTLALIAVTRDRMIGIDVEYCRPDVLDQNIAERFFSPREVATLRSLPEAQQEEAFFNCWTRKEAFIKAKGEGLSLPLDRFDVSLAPDEPAALLETRPDRSEAQHWSLVALDVDPPYKAALAVRDQGFQTLIWNFPA
ncbi:MAG: 4'-phosphopantetheinyl transferase superfamily protein [Bacteroidota bacterium]